MEKILYAHLIEYAPAFRNQFLSKDKDVQCLHSSLTFWVKILFLNYVLTSFLFWCFHLKDTHTIIGPSFSSWACGHSVLDMGHNFLSCAIPFQLSTVICFESYLHLVWGLRFSQMKFPNLNFFASLSVSMYIQPIAILVMLYVFCFFLRMSSFFTRCS